MSGNVNNPAGMPPKGLPQVANSTPTQLLSTAQNNGKRGRLWSLVLMLMMQKIFGTNKHLSKAQLKREEQEFLKTAIENTMSKITNFNDLKSFLTSLQGSSSLNGELKDWLGSIQSQMKGLTSKYYAAHGGEANVNKGAAETASSKEPQYFEYQGLLSLEKNQMSEIHDEGSQFGAAGTKAETEMKQVQGNVKSISNELRQSITSLGSVVRG